MNITRADEAEVRLAGATDGFHVDTGDPRTDLFFHWVPDSQHGAHYSDVLAAFPARMFAFGFHDEIQPMLGEIVGIFGAG